MRYENYRHQSGITLIESLVAIFIAALGILGILGVQMRTLTDTSTTVRRAQAVRLIEDLGERMKTNPNSLAVINSYTSAFSDNPAIPTGACTANCTSAQLAAYDVAAWKQTVRTSLPLGQASLFTPPAEAALASGQRRQLGVMIAWRENEIDIANATEKTIQRENIDATKVRAADGSLSAGGGTDTNTNACPVNFTCHLQYIPVAGRCAPYSPGTNITGFYCPGP